MLQNCRKQWKLKYTAYTHTQRNTHTQQAGDIYWKAVKVNESQNSVTYSLAWMLDGLCESVQLHLNQADIQL